MAKPELGTKRTCPVTGKKFYDLNRDPIVSPYTGQKYPRSMFDPQAKLAAKAPEVDEDETELVVADPNFVPLEAVEADDPAKAAVVDDIEIEDDIGAEDDTFLEPEEDEDDGDVADLIDGDLEEDEET
ncbi:MAG: TIGR02300 family protein [Methylobacterium sp.]|nr:MAG: TIGR02300 family protein [Methylobacterium sp.]